MCYTYIWQHVCTAVNVPLCRTLAVCLHLPKVQLEGSTLEVCYLAVRLVVYHFIELYLVITG